MNTKTYFLSIILFLCFLHLINAQEIKLPLQKKSGHLISIWKVNNSIQTYVMLETGFPKMIISEQYALKHLKNLVRMKKAAPNQAIQLWGTKSRFKVLFTIKDTLKILGKNLYVDAFVVDVSKIKSWKNFDILLPIKDLPGITEINIKDQHLIINRNIKYLQTYKKINVEYDKHVKGLFLNTTLALEDKKHINEKLKGRFLLDLGAPNALFLNRDQTNVEDFMKQVDRMLLKDSTKFKPNPRIKLAILIPEKFYIENMYCKQEFVVALKLVGQKSQKYTGIIGNKFFSNFKIAFDYKNKKVYLKPNTHNVGFVKN